MGQILPSEEKPADDPVMMVFRDGCYVPAGPNARHGMPSASVFRVSNPPDVTRVGPPVVNPASLRSKQLQAVQRVIDGKEGLCFEGVVESSEPGVVSLYRQQLPSREEGDDGEAEADLDEAFAQWWDAERDGFPNEHNPAKRAWLGYADFGRGRDQHFRIGPIALLGDGGTGSPGSAKCIGPADPDDRWRFVLVVSCGRECQRVKTYLKEAQASRRASAGSLFGAGLGLDLEMRPSCPDGEEMPIDLEEHTCLRLEKPSSEAWGASVVKQCVRVGDDLYLDDLNVMFGNLGTRRMPKTFRRQGSGFGTCGLDTPRSASAASQQEEDEPASSTCVICMLEPRDTALLPCRHLCMCSSCADVVRLRSQACPICRQSIQSLISIDTPIEVST